MMFSKKNTLRMTALLASIFLCQCSKEGISADFHVSVNPERPLVHEVGRTINGDTEIEPDWFKMNLNVSNQTGHSIKIEEVTFTIEDEGDGDPPLHSIDLGSLAQSCGDEVYNYADYCTYPDGYSGPWRACLEDASSALDLGYDHCPGSDSEPQHDIPYVTNVIGYVDGIDVSDDHDTGSKVYSVMVEMKGLIIDGGIEKDRFTKRMYFTTR